ncbi:MAG: DMT family transporter [Cyclobacteriaceae bacterium]|nr:DMT family transporter [Cyclobacteriaceae bacterium]
MNKFWVHTALFTVALLYGGNYSIAKFAMPEYISPFGFIAIRIIVSTILFWIIHHFSSKEKIVSKADYIRLFFSGLFGVAINQLMFFKGLSLTTPINASIIMTLSPVVVVVGAYIAGNEKLSIWKIMGLLIGATGAYLLITKDGVSFSNQNFVGNLFIFVNACSYATYLIVVKKLMLKYQSFTVVKWVFLFGGIIAIPFGIVDLMNVNWLSLPTVAWTSILYVIIGVTFLAYLLNTWGLKFVNASVVGIYIYLQPAIATGIAILLKSDTFEINYLFYAFLIMISVFLVSKK